MKYSLLEDEVMKDVKSSVQVAERKFDSVLKRDCWVGGAGGNMSSAAYYKKKKKESKRSDDEEEALFQQIWHSPDWTGPRDENYRYENDASIKRVP